MLWTVWIGDRRQVTCSLLKFADGGIELQLHQGETFYKGRRCYSMADALDHAGKVYGDLLGQGWVA